MGIEHAEKSARLKPPLRNSEKLKQIPLYAIRRPENGRKKNRVAPFGMTV